MSNPIILIPSRLAATRLPQKPLADICGRPMIVHVWERACLADIGRVVVATDSREIAAVIGAAGGTALLTGSHHQSGSDRIVEALEIIDSKGVHDVVLNVQGDLPTLDPRVIRKTLIPFADEDVMISTLVATITREEEREDPNVVKCIGSLIGEDRLRVHYFTRARAPWGEGPLYHHIGLYGFRRQALARFVQMRPSPLEQRERLEQLRAIEAGMRIDAMIVDTVPLGVDTPEHLDRARSLLQSSC